MKLTKKLFSILLAVMMMLTVFVGCETDTTDKPLDDTLDNSINNDNKIEESKGDLKVHYIDVGQADCIYIDMPNGKNVLIDAGNRDDREVIKKYLDGLNVDKIDYFVLTHPHEDHIGSAPDVINNYNVGTVYMPDYTVTTKIFESTITAIKDNKVKAVKAVGGEYIVNENDLKLQILAPNSAEYKETNEYSIVTKLTYKNNSFIFTGDAEKVSEQEMINKGYDLKADVLKVGHHGGRTSTTEEFLKLVSPTYAVIQCGKDNDYGHPHKEVLDRLNRAHVDIYRNDLLGTIVASSDGSKITFDKVVEKNDTATDINKEMSYIGNKNSKVYHTTSCKSLPKQENQVKFKSKSEAEANGYKPCSICNP